MTKSISTFVSMCGRYVTITKVKEIEKRFGVTASQLDKFNVNANVTPGQFAPVVTNEAPAELNFFKFGLTPFWAKKQMYVINARSEGDHNKDNDPKYKGAKGIISKPMFRQSIRSKRCLVIADAFIEGPEKEKLSKPFCVYKRDGDRPFAFAGLWDEWVDKSSGEILNSFAIITSTANHTLRKIGHHRSPVILEQELEKAWLDDGLALAEVTDMLRPYPDDGLNAYPISTAIKSPQNHGLELLKPVGERIDPEFEYELFSEIKLEGMGAAPARQRRLFDE